MARSPAEARQGGVVSVYQEPAVIPDLDIRSNLRLTKTPVEPFRHWLAELGIGDLDLSDMARDLPLATLRVIDLARALSIEPDVLMLDEMTAALPADLTERVLHVIGNQRGSDRCIIFISHRLIEIAAVCDRATVLREGETVGVVDVNEGSEDRIVALMLGDSAKDLGPAAAPAPAAAGADAPTTPRLIARDLRVGARLKDVYLRTPCRRGPRRWPPSKDRARTSCSTCSPGRAAPTGGELLVDGVPVSFRHPGGRHPGRPRLRPRRPGRGPPDAAVDPRERGPALPRRVPLLGTDRDDAEERDRVAGAVAQLQIDTRAASEVRQLSGGNQQKVTIARWVAGGVQTMLCFDPTRGIDIGTKQQIYELVRELAAAGAAVLFYTSELKEIQLACDRAIVIFGGRFVAEIPVDEADEPTLLRAAYDLPPDVPMPEEVAATELEAEAADPGLATVAPDVFVPTDPTGSGPSVSA